MTKTGGEEDAVTVKTTGSGVAVLGEEVRNTRKDVMGPRWIMHVG